MSEQHFKKQRAKTNTGKQKAGSPSRPQKEQSGNLDPYEINFLPEYETDRGPRHAFVNEHGVVIGDYQYDSPNSPLNQWSEETDPAVMAGEEWVHPFKDIGFHTDANKAIFEQGETPQEGPMMHPDQDVVRQTLDDDDADQEPG